MTICAIILSNMVRNAESYQADLQDFLSPRFPYETSGQLSLMRDFLGELGLRVPKLSVEQQNNIDEKLDNNPDLRLLPTFLPNHVWERPQLVPDDLLYTYKDHAKTGARDSEKWAELWEERPQPLVVDDGMMRHLYDGSQAVEFRYKAGGELVTREAYMGWLKATSQVIPQAGGVWSMPIMEVSNQARREERTTEDLYREVDPIVSPEACINKQLLYRTAGMAINQDITEYVNEAVCVLGREEVEFLGATGITWSNELSRIRQAWWKKDFPFYDAQIPQGFSGLGEIPELSAK